MGSELPRTYRLWGTARIEQLWSRTFSGEAIIKDVAADAYGGLILVLTDTFERDGLPQRVQRIDGATGAVSWQYCSADGDLSEVAVHPDGRVCA